MNKQLRDVIGRAATRVNLAAGILTSILPEVIRINVARILGPYLGQPQQQPQNDAAAGCPFSGGAAAQPAAPPAEAGKCPFTGQSAAAEDVKTDVKAEAPAAEKTAAKTDSAKTEASGTKQTDAVKPAPAKAAAKKPAAKTTAAKKPAAKTPAAKKAAQTQPAAKKQSAAKPAAKAASKKSAPKKEQANAASDIVVGDLTAAQLKKLKRTELYDIAQDLKIPGRKDMRKAELFDAIQKELKLA